MQVFEPFATDVYYPIIYSASDASYYVLAYEYNSVRRGDDLLVQRARKNFTSFVSCTPLALPCILHFSCRPGTPISSIFLMCEVCWPRCVALRLYKCYGERETSVLFSYLLTIVVLLNWGWGTVLMFRAWDHAIEITEFNSQSSLFIFHEPFFKNIYSGDDDECISLK